ncbi:MAG: hypothetical protein IPJ13_08025 [Saprospiraceae bacterium]|nr:hypothetical protein [Saprospiraceae bacterium]
MKTAVDHSKWQGKKLELVFLLLLKMVFRLQPANIDSQFINYPVDSAFSEALGCDVTVVNDADDAGIR